MGSTDPEKHFSFHQVLFFGRSLKEYKQMFNLNLEELKGFKILDCPAGPSSFTAETKNLQIDSTACDPLYAMDGAELVELSLKHMEECIERQDQTPHLFDADKPVTEYKQEKRAAFKLFADDIKERGDQGRYLAASLPELPFKDKSFDMVLSGNFLFLYSDHCEGGMLFDSPFDYQFHLDSILEFIRVCRGEIRLYPLKGPHQNKMPFIEELMEELPGHGAIPELVPVPYRDVVDAHHMLKITAGA